MTDITSYTLSFSQKIGEKEYDKSLAYFRNENISIKSYNFHLDDDDNKVSIEIPRNMLECFLKMIE